MHSQIDWDLLRSFLFVAKKGSLSQAAAELHMNHSTISRRLKTLEKQLQCRLVERTLSGVELTPQGDRLFKATAAMADDLARGLDDLAVPGQALQAQLRVSTEDTFGYKVLPPVLGKFSHAYPGVQLDLNITSRYLNMTRREADVLITAREEPPPYLVGRRLGDIRIAMMATPSYIKERGQPKTVKDLTQHRILAPDPALAHLAMARWVNQHVPEECISQRSDKLLYLYQLAKLGHGVAPLPHFLLDDELVELFELPKSCWSAAWVLTHPDIQDAVAVKAFIRFVAENVSI